METKNIERCINMRVASMGCEHLLTSSARAELAALVDQDSRTCSCQPNCLDVSLAREAVKLAEKAESELAQARAKVEAMRGAIVAGNAFLEKVANGEDAETEFGDMEIAFGMWKESTGQAQAGTDGAP